MELLYPVTAKPPAYTLTRSKEVVTVFSAVTMQHLVLIGSMRVCTMPVQYDPRAIQALCASYSDAYVWHSISGPSTNAWGTPADDNWYGTNASSSVRTRVVYAQLVLGSQKRGRIADGLAL